MKLSLMLPTVLAASGIFASVSAAAAKNADLEAPTTTTGLRANTATKQDARRTNRYWVAPVRNSGLTCIDNSIRAGGGKPNEICMTEGEALCIEYDYKPMGGRWQFGIKDSKLRLYNPKGEVVYEYCKDVTHLCIGEEHGFDPNRYSKERPYLTLYDEKVHEVVGSLTCDGTDGKNDENIGQSSILKLVDQADVGPYANYPLTLVKFKKGQTEDPDDDNSLWDITVTEPVATAAGLQLESFLNYNADRCEWNSYVDSFEDLKRQIAAATDSDPDNRAKIETCDERPIVFEDIIDFSNKYFELSCLGDGCVFDLDGYSFVTPFGGSAFYAEFESITIENGSSNKGRDPNQYSDEWGGAFFVRGITPAESALILNDCTLRNNVALSDSGVIDSLGASVVAIDSVFTDNESGNDGGVAYIENFSSFENCRFERNAAANDGGAFILYDSISFENCYFGENVANDDGGAVILEEGFTVATFQGCQFYKNKAEGTATSNHGGAIYVDEADATFVDCRFEMNSAITDGGAIAAFTSGSTTSSSATVRLQNCNFYGNTAFDDGGGLRVVRSVAALEDCSFDHNVARDDGGAIYASASDLDIIGGTLVGNTAEDGGAIYASASDLDLNGGTLVENAAEFGGAIFAMSTSSTIVDSKFGGNSAFRTGGAIIALDSTTNSQDCDFDGNTAGFDGGAIFLEGGRRPSNLNGCTFNRNEAIFAGAVLLHTGTVASIEGCDFRDNFAEVGGAIFAENAQSEFNGCGFSNNFAELGGAISTDESETQITNMSKFECNGAFVGGAMLNVLGTVDISDVEFTNNGASGGGALFFFNADSSIDDSFFDQNKGDVGGATLYISFSLNFTQTINGTIYQNNTALFDADDILYDAPQNIQCGLDHDNCFCDADVASLPDITTNDPSTTCSGADVGSGCSGCILTPMSTCPASSRAGAVARAESLSDGKMDMDGMLAMLEGKMKSREENEGAMKEKMG